MEPFNHNSFKKQQKKTQKENMQELRFPFIYLASPFWGFYWLYYVYNKQTVFKHLTLITGDCWSCQKVDIVTNC